VINLSIGFRELTAFVKKCKNHPTPINLEKLKKIMPDFIAIRYKNNSEVVLTRGTDVNYSIEENRILITFYPYKNVITKQGRIKQKIFPIQKVEIDNIIKIYSYHKYIKDLDMKTSKN